MTTDRDQLWLMFEVNAQGIVTEIGENERVTAIHAGSDLHNIEGCATI